jgi:hypothetical protein
MLQHDCRAANVKAAAWTSSASDSRPPPPRTGALLAPSHWRAPARYPAMRMPEAVHPHRSTVSCEADRTHSPLDPDNAVREADDLVEEDRAAMSDLQPAGLRLSGIGECTALEPEELGFKQRVWNRRAVHIDERRVRSRALLMDHMCDEPLPVPGLTSEGPVVGNPDSSWIGRPTAWVPARRRAG